MIINIHTPNPATFSTLYAMKKVKHWKLKHQVAFFCLDKIFPTWNSLIKGKNLSQLLYDRLWKPNMSISKTEFDPESINDSRWLKSISLYNFYVWSWCAVEISTPPKKKSLTNVIW